MQSRSFTLPRQQHREAHCWHVAHLPAGQAVCASLVEANTQYWPVMPSQSKGFVHREGLMLSPSWGQHIICVRLIQDPSAYKQQFKSPNDL